MCDLKSEPWRAQFTGEPCMCGVPTAGTPEEKAVEKMHRMEELLEQRAEHKRQLEQHRLKRLNEIHQRLGY